MTKEVNASMKSKNRSRLLSSAIVWAIVLMLWTLFSFTPSVMAINRLGGTATGETKASVGIAPCHASVPWIALPQVLQVASGDMVYYTYNFTWDDDRGPSSPEAVHHFSIAVNYPGRPPYAIQKVVKTYGGIGDPIRDDLRLNITNVEPGNNVTVQWGATLTISSPYCYCSDYDGGTTYYGP